MCPLGDDDDDAGLTAVGDGVDLTAAVHCYTQHGCLIIPFDVSAFHRVGQEGEVRHHDAVRLLDVVELLQRGQTGCITHTHTAAAA